ncbi:hypothetical protein GN958_ATG11717 [Phytophthora infestans]|uniref:Uncharacterized protein n=1 Tax=Phytophthora infestans TaxID=4787 RepID=A0A8S9UD97_PHYIN|nr:hypothetical protein GN958_ATG11717 [Phytophthora infestans]
MSRSDSIDTIMLQHLEWADDCLVIEEQGHKGDQTGAEKFGKHVYANLYEPSQCPILAAEELLFSSPERVVGGKQQLFIGSDNKTRFGRMLCRVIGDLSEEKIGLLSCNPADIGTHSLRKGSSSYAIGQVNGPTPVSVYLRMGQSLGKLKDRYIHFGEIWSAVTALPDCNSTNHDFFILGEYCSVADKVTSELREHFVVGGVAPVSLRDIASLRADLAAEFRNAISSIQPPRDCGVAAPAETPSAESPSADWHTWQWGDGQLGHAVLK